MRIYRNVCNILKDRGLDQPIFVCCIFFLLTVLSCTKKSAHSQIFYRLCADFKCYKIAGATFSVPSELLSFLLSVTNEPIVRL